MEGEYVNVRKRNAAVWDKYKVKVQCMKVYNVEAEVLCHIAFVSTTSSLQ